MRLAVILGFVLTACSSSQPSSATTATAPPTPLQLAASASPSPSPTNIPAPSCVEQSGVTEAHSIPTDYLSSPLRFLVHRPPCYRSDAERRYPVLYLFHGLVYDETQWERLGALTAADRLITAGEISPFLIVLPYDPSNKEPDQYPFAKAITDVLIPYVDLHYRTCPEAACRAVGGLSRGGGWALHLGLTRPDLFSTIGAHSPAPFWADWPHYDEWLTSIPPEHMPRLWLDVGESDPLRPSAQKLETLLETLAAPHEWYLFQGEHNEAYWRAHVELYLRWYATGWQ